MDDREELFYRLDSMLQGRCDERRANGTPDKALCIYWRSEVRRLDGMHPGFMKYLGARKGPDIWF